MSTYCQSVHLTDNTKEGREILSVLLAIPRYQRSALIRAVLLEHLKDAARQRWPGWEPKTAEELQTLLTARPQSCLSRRSTARVGTPRSPLLWPSPATATVDPGPAEDIEVRLNRLDF